MAKRDRRFRSLGALTLLLCSGGAGCHSATLCEPTSAPFGQLVTAGVSEPYLAQVDKAGGDVAHVACAAETTVITPKVYLRESEDGNCQSTGKYCLGGAEEAYRWKTPMNLPMDQTTVEGKSPMQVLQSELRIVGIGKGVSIEDCSEIAWRACQAGHDAYYDRQRGARPLTSGCRIAESQNMCAPAGRRPRTSVAASSREPVVSPEEQLPGTWIMRLGDVKRRPAAIRALIHFYGNAMIRSRQGAGDPVVKGLLDEMVKPLTDVYVAGSLERSTRVLVIRFLAEVRDPRAGHAFIHACHGFATAAGPDEEDVQYASSAIAALKFEEAAPALGEAFAKVEAGTSQGFAASKNIRLAMMQLKSATWRPMLLEKIGAPMDRPRSSDAEQVARIQTQIFWQQTSAELLGALGDASAVKPLLKILMERRKGEIALPALLGIVKIGRTAVPVLTDVLAGGDAEMADFAKSEVADTGESAKSAVMASAVALGALGRGEARTSMIQALKASDNDTNRAVLLRELTALPANAESIKAFQAGYAKVPAAARIWPSMSAAQPALLAASARFYDSAIVPWLLTQANAAKDKDEASMSAALMSAILGMKGGESRAVKTVVEKIGREQEKRAFQAASELLGKCGEDVECYLAKLNEDGDRDPFVGVKAAHMVGMFGDDRAGMELVQRLPKLRHVDVVTEAVVAVDHAVQKDAATVADALQKVVDDASRDNALASTAVEAVLYRLRAR